MGDILGIGISALLANRSALDVAGHNIANVNTDGYSRQRVDLSNAVGSVTSYGYAGNGVTVRDLTTTETETGNLYVIAPVPASVKKASPQSN